MVRSEGWYNVTREPLKSQDDVFCSGGLRNGNDLNDPVLFPRKFNTSEKRFTRVLEEMVDPIVERLRELSNAVLSTKQGIFSCFERIYSV